MDYNDREAIGLALAMENRGLVLYRRSVFLCRSAEAQQLLRDLIEEEEGHVREFEALAQSVTDAPYSEEAAALLAAVAADIAFPDGLATLCLEGKIDDPANVVEYALRSERNSVSFYTGMAQRAGDSRLREVFGHIAETEEKHFTRLTEIRSRFH